MSISSIGACDTQALSLIARLGKSSDSTTSDSLLSLLDTGSDSLSISTQGQWMSRTQDTNPFKTDFDNLGSLISSGDLEEAQAAYAAMQAKMNGAQGGEDPMAGAFAAIGTALDSGDLASAQKAWDSMQSSLASFGASQSGGSTNPLKNDMSQLATLLEAGDLTSAQALYETIQEHVQASGQTDSQSGETNDFGSLFSAVSTALESGDTSAAQEAVAKLDEALKSAGAQTSDETTQSQTSGLADTSDLQALLLSMYWQSSAFTSTLSNG